MNIRHCKKCNERGLVDRDRGKHPDNSDPFRTVLVPCPDCNGTKHIIEMEE